MVDRYIYELYLLLRDAMEECGAVVTRFGRQFSIRFPLNDRQYTVLLEVHMETVNGSCFVWNLLGSKEKFTSIEELVSYIERTRYNVVAG